MPAVCRGNLVDADLVHCSLPRRLELSPNVRVNGTGISRETDLNDVHEVPGTPCTLHQAPIAFGSPLVRINNLGCGRIGDIIAGCTAVATGSPNVFAGP